MVMHTLKYTTSSLGKSKLPAVKDNLKLAAVSYRDVDFYVSLHVAIPHPYPLSSTVLVGIKIFFCRTISALYLSFGIYYMSWP